MGMSDRVPGATTIETGMDDIRAVIDAEAAVRMIPARWGKGLGFGVFVPSVGDVEWGRAWLGRVQLHACRPASWAAFARMAFGIDVRHVAPSINVPTLIVHALEDAVCHVENARFLVRTIPGARYVELPGGDHVPLVRSGHTLAEIREFLTSGARGPHRTGCSRPFC
jgi:pimeloyl-ACP methyl ester carboxylesterase